MLSWVYSFWHGVIPTSYFIFTLVSLLFSSYRHGKRHLSLNCKGCFGPLKGAWREVCHQYVTEHPGKVVTKFPFSSHFNTAWTRSMTVANIVGGFQVPGVHLLAAMLSLLPVLTVKVSVERLAFHSYQCTVLLHDAQPSQLTSLQRKRCLFLRSVMRMGMT